MYLKWPTTQAMGVSGSSITKHNILNILYSNSMESEYLARIHAFIAQQT